MKHQEAAEETSQVQTVGIGLDLFSEETPRRVRLRFLAIFAMYTTLLLLVIWPVFPQVNRVEPYVLGLPLNMAWNSAVLFLTMITGFLMYWYDEIKVQGGT
jgi:hypothetical protein